MTTVLAETFVGTTPREKAGSRTSNRFDFQKNWALCKLLSLHELENDYLLILDYHEDVVVFDSANNPQNADFFQIKTKSPGNWTVNALSKVDKNKTTSIFEKLYQNQKLFGDTVRSLWFVSNQGLSAKLFDGNKAIDRKEIKFTDLCCEDKEKLCNCVHEKDDKNCDWSGMSKFCLRRTDLSLKDHAVHTTGRLADFLDKLLPNKNISAVLAYKSIFGEISRKTSSEESCSNLGELRDRKGICKDTFSKMISRIQQAANSSDMWNDVRSQLEHEQFEFSEIQILKHHWTKYTVDRMDANNDDLYELRKEINSQINKLFNDGNSFTLRKATNTIMPNLQLLDKKHYEENYIRIAVICEAIYYETIQETCQKSEEETA